MSIMAICLLQSESSIDSCEDPKASKQSRIEEETDGNISSASEDTVDCSSIASTDSDHGATAMHSRGGRGATRGHGATHGHRTHSHGATRGRGTTCGHGTTRGYGVVTGGCGRGRDQNPLGQWKKEEPSSLCFNYGLTPGPRIHLHNITPLELFCKYFTDEVWDLLVTETNRYACSRFPCRQHARPWTDISTDEMKAFIGMLLLMGILQLPRIEMYWQTDDDLMKTPGISSIMSCVRFQQIFRFLHLADNSHQIPAGQPGHDKLYKVRSYVDLISTQFTTNYTLHQPVTIDEAMILFKGRLTFKQYMKNKPTKWGIKVFVLSDATNGYVYTGYKFIQVKTSSQMMLMLDFAQGYY